MNDLPNRSSPPIRVSTLIYIGVAFGVLFGGWLALQYFTRDARTRLVGLPLDTQAEITEDIGEFSSDDTHTITILRGGKRSANYQFYPEDWPVACRFYADALHPTSLTIIQFNPVFVTDNPGRWLDAESLEEIPLESLPDSLIVLGQQAIK